MELFRRRWFDKQTIVNSVFVGIVIATICVAWASTMFMISGGRSLEKFGLGLPTTIVIYLTGGVVGGALVGVLFPLTRWIMGAAAVGYLAVAPFFFALALQIADSRDEVIVVTLGGSILGGALGVHARREEKRLRGGGRPRV